MFKSKNPSDIVESCSAALKTHLGENLKCCLIYGSMVRGQFIEDQSDINLLILLKESTFQAHQVIGQIIRSHSPINPFIIGEKGLDRTMKVFGLKFSSIRRNYKVLSGEDPFVDFTVASGLDRFLCEQSLRNLQLRHTHFFTMSGHDRKRYSKYLIEVSSSVLTDVSEVARLNGAQLPQNFKDRISILEANLNFNCNALSELLLLKENSKTLTEAEVLEFQGKISQVLGNAIFWIEKNWELPLPRGTV